MLTKFYQFIIKLWTAFQLCFDRTPDDLPLKTANQQIAILQKQLDDAYLILAQEQDEATKERASLVSEKANAVKNAEEWRSRWEKAHELTVLWAIADLNLELRTIPQIRFRHTAHRWFAKKTEQETQRNIADLKAEVVAVQSDRKMWKDAWFRQRDATGRSAWDNFALGYKAGKDGVEMYGVRS